MNKSSDLSAIAGLCRIETTPKEDMQELCMEMTHAVYPHDSQYGQFCTIQEYIDCPAPMAYDYLSKTENLLEWTYSLREMSYDAASDLYRFTDAVGGKTLCFCRTQTNPAARTVDYHCAWDQSSTLWMIYLMRVIPAELVLGKPGCVVLWTNCHHTYYDQNPFPEAAPADRKIWVGDMWPMFYAGHSIEMQNLKRILEYRYATQQHTPVIAPALNPATA